METLTITDLPDETVAELETRAASTGLSVEDYVRGQLIDLHHRPDLDVLLERAAERRERLGLNLDNADIIDDLAQDRR
ncbi:MULTISPECIES: FitA-like ribbon-helix-helix domain-containing protein [unclassified Luteococcus]|uniref:FitA-like ribbon-helix-helix domain-containing protein n=1 Tax=unclassified Luteococcus TaxID=2639923 RepID=UPI00313DE252